MSESFALTLERLHLKVARPLSQTERIIRLLKRRGTFGASSRELNTIAFRYSARIGELRGDGYNIRTMRDSAGSFRYILESDDE